MDSADIHDIVPYKLTLERRDKYRKRDYEKEHSKQHAVFQHAAWMQPFMIIWFPELVHQDFDRPNPVD